MITLTYPGSWQVWVPDAAMLRRHREAFKERWRRKFGTPIGVWVVEFQKRGAPHIHLYVGLPDAVSDKEYLGLQTRTMRRRRAERDVGSYEARRRERPPTGEFAMWLRETWWQVVGRGIDAHHVRGVDIAVSFFSADAEQNADRLKVAQYFWRESGKWGQKDPPPEFGSLKFYGIWGQKEGFKPIVTTQQLSEAAGLELRRMLRRLMRAKMRTRAAASGRTVRRNAGKPRGRDGLTVFDVVSAREVAAKLIGLAESLAFEKATSPRQLERLAFPTNPAEHKPKNWTRAYSEVPAPGGFGGRNPRLTAEDDAAIDAWLAAADPGDAWPDFEEERRQAADDALIELWLGERDEEDDPEAAYEAWLEREAEREAAISEYLRKQQARERLEWIRKQNRRLKRA